MVSSVTLWDNVMELILDNFNPELLVESLTSRNPISAPHGLQPAGPSVQGISPARTLEWSPFPPPGDLPGPPGIESWVSCTAGGFFTITEAPGSPLLPAGRMPRWSAPMAAGLKDLELSRETLRLESALPLPSPRRRLPHLRPLPSVSLALKKALPALLLRLLPPCHLPAEVLCRRLPIEWRCLPPSFKALQSLSLLLVCLLER